MRIHSLNFAFLWLAGLLLLLANTAWAEQLVYRVDYRSMEEIVAAGGMYPRATAADPNRNALLVPHLEGSSVSDGTAAFVSTSHSITHSIRFARQRLRHHEQEAPDIYQYVIRPDSNFYDVRAALARGIRVTDDSAARLRLSRAAEMNDVLREVSALNGFSLRQIAQYRRLTRQQVSNFVSGIISEAQLPAWINNPSFDRSSSSGEINFEPYEQLGTPTGYMEVVPGEGEGEGTPVRFSALLLACYSALKGQAALSMSGNPASTNYLLGPTGTSQCPAPGSVHIRRIAYDPTIAKGVAATLAHHHFLHHEFRRKRDASVDEAATHRWPFNWLVSPFSG